MRFILVISLIIIGINGLNKPQTMPLPQFDDETIKTICIQEELEC